MDYRLASSSCARLAVASDGGPRMDPKKDAEKDSKKDPEKDILEDVDLSGLFEKRAEAVKKQKQAQANVRTAQVVHFSFFWIAACATAAVAAKMLPEDDPVGAFLLPAAVILGIVAFFPLVHGLQDKERAAT